MTTGEDKAESSTHGGFREWWDSLPKTGFPTLDAKLQDTRDIAQAAWIAARLTRPESAKAPSSPAHSQIIVSDEQLEKTYWDAYEAERDNGIGPDPHLIGLRAVVEACQPSSTTPAATERTNFTAEQVKNLDEFQRAGVMHPFTCPNRGDGKHFDNGVDKGALIPTTRGWICQCCDYTQDWAHDFMLNGEAVKESSFARSAIACNELPKGFVSLDDYIAELEKDPAQKALLDNARAWVKANKESWIRDTPPTSGTTDFPLGFEHDLKCWPEYFEHVLSGAKPFEVRRNHDRKFSVGDVLLLREFLPGTQRYSGRECRRIVTFVLDKGPFAMPGHAILGLSAKAPSAMGTSKRVRDALANMQRVMGRYQWHHDVPEAMAELTAALSESAIDIGKV